MQRRQGGEEPSQPKRMNRAQEARDEAYGATTKRNRNMQRRQGGEEPSQPKRMNRAQEARDEADGAITKGNLEII